jgi:nanoRNase/pAp phosphatase (c-di-AMP/oligoRNAs hydrolase)
VTPDLDLTDARGLVCLVAVDDRVIAVVRTRVPELDARAIARALGGGGHRQAAGFTTELPFEELVERLRSEIAAQR